MKKYLGVFDTKCLHRIMEDHWDDFMPNQQLHQETELRPLTSIVYEYQLWTYEHLVHFLNYLRKLIEIVSERTR